MQAALQVVATVGSVVAAPLLNTNPVSASTGPLDRISTLFFFALFPLVPTLKFGIKDHMVIPQDVGMKVGPISRQSIDRKIAGDSHVQGVDFREAIDRAIEWDSNNPYLKEVFLKAEKGLNLYAKSYEKPNHAEPYNFAAKNIKRAFEHDAKKAALDAQEEKLRVLALEIEAKQKELQALAAKVEERKQKKGAAEKVAQPVEEDRDEVKSEASGVEESEKTEEEEKRDPLEEVRSKIREAWRPEEIEYIARGILMAYKNKEMQQVMINASFTYLEGKQRFISKLLAEEGRIRALA